MPKTTIALSIDIDVMEKAREKVDKGDLSSLVENFLKAYLGIENMEEIPEDMIDLIKEEEILLAQDAQIKAKLEKIARRKKKEGAVHLDFST